MDTQKLLKLREEIVSSTRELALNSNVAPVDKLEVLMGIIHSGDASLEILIKAYETAQELSEDEGKMSAFLDIVSEIDEELTKGNNSTDSSEDSPESSTADYQS